MSIVKAELEKTIASCGGRMQPPYRSFREFVLFNGKQFQTMPFPDQYKHCSDTVGECYKNAYLLVLHNPEMTYCEGCVQRAGASHVFIGIHAWAIDSRDRVIDPTWKSEGVDYFGVPFDFIFVNLMLKRTRVCGVIDNYQADFPLLSGEAKNWKANKAA